MKTQLLENNQMKIKKATKQMCNDQRNTIAHKIVAIDLMTTNKRQ